MMKSLAFGLVLFALVAPICLNWIEAQKTIKKGSQTRPQTSSVYGGYQAQQNVPRPPVQQPQLQQEQQQQQSEYSSTFQQAARPTAQQSQQSSASSYEESASEEVGSGSADAEPASYGSVSGQPGKDFPAYTRIPKTKFSCDGLPYDYGMYADEETGCQAYHLCYNGRKDSFLCGVGTVFNQRILHCDYWYSVDCGKSSQYYSSNAYMGSAQPEPGPAQSSGSAPQSAQSQYSSASQQPAREASGSSLSKTSAQQWNRNTQQQSEENY